MPMKVLYIPGMAEGKNKKWFRMDVLNPLS
jgi:hypothetical protein